MRNVLLLMPMLPLALALKVQLGTHTLTIPGLNAPTASHASIG
jgi:hypothetical protein